MSCFKVCCHNDHRNLSLPFFVFVTFLAFHGLLIFFVLFILRDDISFFDNEESSFMKILRLFLRFKFMVFKLFIMISNIFH